MDCVTPTNENMVSKQDHHGNQIPLDTRGLCLHPSHSPLPFLFMFFTCIPDLSLDYFVIDLNATSGKFDTNGTLGLEVEFITSESSEKVGLADTRVTNEDN